MKEVLEGALELDDALPYIDNCLGLPGVRDRVPVGRAVRRAAHAFPRPRRAAARPRAADRAQRMTDAGDAALPGAVPARRSSRRCREAAGAPSAVAHAFPRSAAMLDAAARRGSPDASRCRRYPGRRAAPGSGRAARRLRPAGPRPGYQLGDAARARAQRRRDGDPVGPGMLRGACAAHRAGRRVARSHGAPQPRRPFAGTDVDAIITNAAGCGSGMQEYALLFRGRARAGGRRPRLRRARPSTSASSSTSWALPQPPRAAAPCASPTTTPATSPTPRACATAPRALLAAIRASTSSSLPNGSSAVARPAHTTSRSPRSPASSAQRKAGNLLATGAESDRQPGNIGCITQIRAHLRGSGTVPVLHTIQILDRAYTQTLARSPPMRRSAITASFSIRGSTTAPATRSSPPMRSSSSRELHGRFGTRRRSCSPPATTASSAPRQAAHSISCPRPARSATASWQVAPPRERLRRPPRRDHRADRPQARHQRAELGRTRVHGRLRGRELADLGTTRCRATSI